MRAADVARFLDIDRSTCHRMLKVLTERGFLTKDAESKKYTLGPTVLRLARAREVIAPSLPAYDQILRRLTQDVDETSHLSLVAGEQLASVAVAEGMRSSRIHHEVGIQLDWHATASGLACLAYSEPEFVDLILARPLRRYTPYTLTSPKAIMTELEAIRERGYSKSLGSFDQDVTGIAVPIFGPDERVEGAISVISPTSRVTPELERKIFERVGKAAAEATEFEAGVPSKEFDAKLPRAMWSYTRVGGLEPMCPFSCSD